MRRWWLICVIVVLDFSPPVGSGLGVIINFCI